MFDISVMEPNVGQVCPQEDLEDWTGVDSLLAPLFSFLVLVSVQLLPIPSPPHPLLILPPEPEAPPKEEPPPPEPEPPHRSLTGHSGLISDADADFMELEDRPEPPIEPETKIYNIPPSPAPLPP